MPVPDWSGRHIAYVHAIESGRRLFIADLTGSHAYQIPTPNDVCQIFGWSQDDRYLAFAQAPPVFPPATDEPTIAWLTLYDSQSHQVWRIGNLPAVAEGSATWLTEHRLFYSLHKLGSDYTEKFIYDVDMQTATKVRNYLSDFVLYGTNAGVYFDHGNLRSCRLDTTNYPPVVSLSAFPPNTFEQIRWLQYRPETATFLFCARKTNSDWRCLYEFDTETSRLNQLTTRATYNGQCLGRGYAYVGNTNNQFFLALRPGRPEEATNLFTGGNVTTYAASRDGRKVFAIASTNVEPPGLWEYDIAMKSLQNLVKGQTQSWQAATLAAPQEHCLKSFDGVEIHYFVTPPATMVKNLATTNRFPVVLYLPPATWQFQHGFDLPAEFYANLDCWYVAVNYRGGDGYGRQFAQLQNTANAARDALAVLDQIAMNRCVDARRVILSSESSGGEEVLELLRSQPDRWRGAMLHHPAMGAGDAESLPTNTPPLFIVAGSMERFLPGLQEFTEAANQRGLKAELHIQAASGHETFNTDRIKETLLQELDFVGRVLP